MKFNAKMQSRKDAKAFRLFLKRSFRNRAGIGAPSTTSVFGAPLVCMTFRLVSAFSKISFEKTWGLCVKLPIK
jgi:hypothetical protein